MVSTPTPSGEHAIWTPRRRAYTLGVLCMIGLFNLADRQLLAILLDPIKREMRVSDTAMGLLSGAAFAAFYVVAGIPVARLADRGSRRLLLAGAVTLWSAATVLTGFARGFIQLVMARIVGSAGEAGSGPANSSILADLYPPERRATAIGVLISVQSVGIALGLFLGGWIGAHYGWRTAFIVIGAPGVLIAALLLLSVPEPPRGMFDAGVPATDNAPSLRITLGFALGSRPLRLLFAVAGACSFVGYAVLGWGPTFFIRVHHMTPVHVGVWMGLATAGGLAIGNFLSGALTDRIARGDPARSMQVAGWGMALAAPLGATFVLAHSTAIAFTAMFAAYISLTFWLPPTTSALLTLSPSRMRGVISALMALCQMLLGLGLGPTFVGVMNDALAPSFGEQSIRVSLLIVMAVLAGCGALCFITARTLRRHAVPRPIEASAG